MFIRDCQSKITDQQIIPYQERNMLKFKQKKVRV